MINTQMKLTPVAVQEEAKVLFRGGSVDWSPVSFGAETSGHGGQGSDGGSGAGSWPDSIADSVTVGLLTLRQLVSVTEHHKESAATTRLSEPAKLDVVEVTNIRGCANLVFHFEPWFHG